MARHGRASGIEGARAVRHDTLQRPRNGIGAIYDWHVRMTDWEEQRLLVFSAAELARRHRDAGLRLNAPEAIALMCDAMFEAARAGATYEDVESAGAAAVKPDEVLDGVAELVDEVRLEVLMDDGTRLVVLRQPLGPGAAGPEPASPPLPPERETITLEVTNTGTHVVRVSSHYPFDQVNKRLSFDRRRAHGFRLDLPAGSTLRWAPGETRTVTLVRYGGAGAP